MKCYFCNKTTSNVDSAISEGWNPSFWDEEADCQMAEPYCQECAKRWLIYDEVFGDDVLPRRIPCCSGS